MRLLSLFFCSMKISVLFCVRMMVTVNCEFLERSIARICHNCSGNLLLKNFRMHGSSKEIAKKCLDLLPKFEAIFGSGSVKTSESVRNQYSRDESHHEPRLPEVVLTPRSVEQVSAAVKLCNDFRVPVIPFGTGTGLEGGVVHCDAGITLDMKGMDQILDVNEEDFDCVVQPGVTRKALNEAIRATGLYFTVDPGADASVCGMVATGASGTTSVRYGTIKSNTKNLQIVLANGDILDTRGAGRRPWKSSAGFNLTELFIGQEGTLGIITAACINLHPRPQCISAAVCPFPSVRDAIEAVVGIRQLALPVARIEFLDGEQMKASNLYKSSSYEETPTLFLEFHGATERDVEEQATAAKDICESTGATSFLWSTTQEEMNRLWSGRHAAYYAALSLVPGATGFTTDVCVPISRLKQVLAETREEMDSMGIIGTLVGHVGEGNFHCVLPVDHTDTELMERVWLFSDRLVQRALTAGGTCTGEHGVGQGKIKYVEEEFGPVGIEVFRSLKRTLDPKNILNPGKVIRMS